MANQRAGKAPSDSPALKPYRGKPALRNFRGGNGNVGIIRSPVRAIALPDNRSTMLRPMGVEWAGELLGEANRLWMNLVLQSMPGELKTPIG